MKKNFLALFGTLCFFGVMAQTPVIMVKTANSKTWGYADLTGKMIIDQQFDKCYEFSEDGYAPVYDAEKKHYYFINVKGEKLATEINDYKLKDGFGFKMENFSNGLIPIKRGEMWGCMDTRGKVAIPAQYDEISGFNDGYAVGRKGTSFFVIDTKGTETPIAAGVVDVKEFSEKLAPYRAADKKFGFVATEGKIVIPAQFESVGYFSSGLAWAKTADKKLGYINTKGEWVIKPQFEAGKEFDAESGLARVKIADKWAYVNKSGAIVEINDTESWGDFSSGLAQGKKGGKVGFYNSKGEWIIQPYLDGSRDFVNGYAAAKKGNKWGVIDKTGKWVIEPQFDGIKDVEIVK